MAREDGWPVLYREKMTGFQGSDLVRWAVGVAGRNDTGCTLLGPRARLWFACRTATASTTPDRIL
jgi:hypothetical protein